LDYEDAVSYSLVISAFDGSASMSPSQRHFANLIVNISITDVNDNAPTFSESQYVVTVGDGVTIDTSVVQVHASDRDSGENGLVRFSFDEVRYDIFRFCI